MAIQYYADQNVEGKLTVSTVLRVNDSGSSIKGVGINTMNPGGELQVVGAGSIGNIYISANAAGSSVTDSLHIKKEALKASIINRDGGDLALGANSNEYVTIKATGNVGIGTTSTNYKLDVYGNLKVGTTGAFTISQSQFGTTQFYVAGGGNGGTVIFGVPASYQQNVSVQGDLYTASGSTSSYLGTKRFGSFNNRLDPDGDNYLNSGNLGIGTTSPSARLEVQGTNSNTQAAFKVTDSGDSFFEVVPDNSTTFKIGDLDAVGDEAMIVGTFSDITFSKGGTTTMILDSNNRVGIGTTAPLEKLQVNGNAAIYGAIKGYTGSSSNQYLSILQSSNLTYISTGTTNETIYFGIGPVANVTNINVAGTATATNFILSSDKTLKDKIKDIKTNHVDIKWKNFELISEPGVKRSGVIAQELEVKHPEFVRTDKDGLKSVAYIDLLITKIAELEARLEKAGL